MDDDPARRTHEAPRAEPGDRGRARHAVEMALAGLRPIVTESHDGLTLVLLAPRRAGPGTMEAASIARAFTLAPDAVGVAVGLFDRVVSLHAFADPDDLRDAWPRLVADAVVAWCDRRDAIEAGTAPPPGRRIPDDGATARLLRRASVALAAAEVRSARDPSVHDASDRSVGAPSQEELDVRIHGDRVGGHAHVSGGRVVRLALVHREPADPLDALVP
jgi:hypothetical protein